MCVYVHETRAKRIGESGLTKLLGAALDGGLLGLLSETNQLQMASSLAEQRLGSRRQTSRELLLHLVDSLGLGRAGLGHLGCLALGVHCLGRLGLAAHLDGSLRHGGFVLSSFRGKTIVRKQSGDGGGGPSLELFFQCRTTVHIRYPHSIFAQYANIAKHLSLQLSLFFFTPKYMLIQDFDAPLLSKRHALS